LQLKFAEHHSTKTCTTSMSHINYIYKRTYSLPVWWETEDVWVWPSELYCTDLLSVQLSSSQLHCGNRWTFHTWHLHHYKLHISLQK